MSVPRVCVLKTDGINCDRETAYAFHLAGGLPSIVHINELREGSHSLGSFQILALPGGFSYGDDVASGKVLAVELNHFFHDAIQAFVTSGNLVIGICNGFQVLVRMGLLPSGQLGPMQATLLHNDCAHFICKWVPLKVEKSVCVFTRGVGPDIQLQIAHGEGKFYAPEAMLDQLEANGQVALRYAANPNGSLRDIAGVTDSTGRVFGLMPHPERNTLPHHPPNWRRGPTNPDGLQIFENAVTYFA